MLPQRSPAVPHPVPVVVKVEPKRLPLAPAAQPTVKQTKRVSFASALDDGGRSEWLAARAAARPASKLMIKLPKLPCSLAEPPPEKACEPHEPEELSLPPLVPQGRFELKRKRDDDGDLLTEMACNGVLIARSAAAGARRGAWRPLAVSRP